MFASLNLNTCFRFSTPAPALRAVWSMTLPRVGFIRPPFSMTTSAVHHKSLTTNSINFSGLEYLWMPVVPQSAVFCLEFNTRQKLLQPVTTLMVNSACEYSRGGLLSSGHKQNGPLRQERSNISEFIQIHNTSINQPLQLPAAQTPLARRCAGFLTLIKLKSFNQTRRWQVVKITSGCFISSSSDLIGESNFLLGSAPKQPFNSNY